MIVLWLLLLLFGVVGCCGDDDDGFIKSLLVPPTLPSFCTSA